jgi:oligoribonuclease NrnB/cAMP/cGMP phosphodiesterase (DHH superfamily)
MANKQNFNYIIYHKGCLDGFSGFFVAHISGRLTKDVFIYEDIPSTNRIPPDIDGKDMLIIDVAYKKDVLEEIFKYARSVVFIDHHDSIKDDVQELYKKYGDQNENGKGRIQIIYDDTRCGATLAWNYLFGRQEIPLFLKYVEDQDTGKWVHPKTRSFIFAVRAYYHLSTENKSLNKWFKLLNKENVAKLIKKGRYMKRYNDHIVNVNIPKHTMERFPSRKIYNMKSDVFERPGQYKVAVYCGHNCPSVTELSVGAMERVDCDFCIMWVYNLDSKKYVLSMRSKEVDIGEICKIFGGGGHKLAAACSFYSHQFKIDDMFEGPSLPRSIKDA